MDKGAETSFTGHFQILAGNAKTWEHTVCHRMDSLIGFHSTLFIPEIISKLFHLPTRSTK